MARRQRSSGSDTDELAELAATALVFLALGGGYKAYLVYKTSPAVFWLWIIAILLIFGAVVVLLLWAQSRLTRRRAALPNDVRSAGYESEVINFINRFGTEKKSKGTWGYRDYNFKWDRLKDFRNQLIEKGIKVSTKKWEDTLSILRFFIQLKEERLTRESVKLAPQQLFGLTGAQFEDLLYRLFSAAGYAVQRTGKVGDQGADLIVNKGGERIIVQAKRYKEAVGNAAVQQAVSAIKYYDCNKASVVTTSSFTIEAMDLAKKNGVEMIEGKRLRELLLKFLKESWV